MLTTCVHRFALSVEYVVSMSELASAMLEASCFYEKSSDAKYPRKLVVQLKTFRDRAIQLIFFAPIILLCEDDLNLRRRLRRFSCQENLKKHNRWLGTRLRPSQMWPEQLLLKTYEKAFIFVKMVLNIRNSAFCNC